jgi:hypothetical protein
MSADDHRKPRRAARLLHFAVMLLLLMAFGWVVEHLLLDEEHLRHLQTIQKEAADGVAAFSPTDLIALYVQAYVSDYKHSPMFVVPEAFIIVLAQLSDQPWPAVIAILVQLVVGFAITVGICFRFRAFYRLKGLDRLWLFTVWLPLGSVIFGSVAAVPVYNNLA